MNSLKARRESSVRLTLILEAILMGLTVTILDDNKDDYTRVCRL